MLFTQKSERFILTEEEREPLLQSVIESLELTDKKKEEFKECNRKIREYRQRKQDARLLRGEKKGHGRKPIPDTMPELPAIYVYPECYYGHEEEYRIVHTDDVKEVIMPAPAKYFIQ